VRKTSFLAGFVVSATFACTAARALAADDAPAWAYPVNPPDFTLAADDGSMRRVPGSDLALTLAQVRNPFLAPDWHPQAHAPMPPVVARGVKPSVLACGYCHRAEGTGGPENASLAGLPAAYIIQQMADFKSGARSTALPSRAPQNFMIKLAAAVGDDDVRAAALYFSGLKPASNMKVVESESAPTTFVAGWFLAPSVPGGKEPLGERIVEVPDDVARFESRDTRVTFTAYVPPGSLRAGEALVMGKDTTRSPACATCHGKDLRGVGDVPSIAGRSPSYIFRQLHEFKTGIRAGSGSASMKPTVAGLDQGDMLAIAAYLATLEP
jgi:cytochrome c553